jgi:hypothetical protein
MFNSRDIHWVGTQCFLEKIGISHPNKSTNWQTGKSKNKNKKKLFGRRPAADPATNNWNSSGARPRNCCLCHQIVAYVIIFPKKFFKANFEVSG